MPRGRMVRLRSIRAKARERLLVVASSLTVVGIVFGTLQEVASKWATDQSVFGILTAGLGTALVVGLISWFLRSRLGRNDVISRDWGQLDIGGGGVLLCQPTTSGEVTATRLTTDSRTLDFAPETPSFALSPDGTVAATLEGSSLRISAIDPATGHVNRWGPTVDGVQAARVLAVARKGDAAVWCAVTGDVSKRAEIGWSSAQQLDWTPITLPNGQIGAAQDAVFVGHTLILLREQNNTIYSAGPDGHASELTALTPSGCTPVALDAAVVGGTTFLGLALLVNAAAEEPIAEFRVFQVDAGGGTDLVANERGDGALEQLHLVRSPFGEEDDLKVVGVSGAKVSQYKPLKERHSLLEIVR